MFGTRTWENRAKIKTFIYDIRKYTDKQVTIVGLGDRHGADPLVKKYALEFGYQYQEVNPPHTPCNLYSLMSEHFYDKPYHAKNVYLQNKIFATVVDSCIVFDDTGGRDKNITRLVNQLNKQGKKVVTIH